MSGPFDYFKIVLIGKWKLNNDCYFNTGLHLHIHPASVYLPLSHCVRRMSGLIWRLRVKKKITISLLFSTSQLYICTWNNFSELQQSRYLENRYFTPYIIFFPEQTHILSPFFELWLMHLFKNIECLFYQPLSYNLEPSSSLQTMVFIVK